MWQWEIWICIVNEEGKKVYGIITSSKPEAIYEVLNKVACTLRKVIKRCVILMCGKVLCLDFCFSYTYRYTKRLFYYLNYSLKEEAFNA